MTTPRELLARIIRPDTWQIVDESGITPESDPLTYRSVTSGSLATAQAVIDAGWTPPAPKLKYECIVCMKPLDGIIQTRHNLGKGTVEGIHVKCKPVDWT